VSLGELPDKALALARKRSLYMCQTTLSERLFEDTAVGQALENVGVDMSPAMLSTAIRVVRVSVHEMLSFRQLLARDSISNAYNEMHNDNTSR
jgi:hypothetical protein